MRTTTLSFKELYTAKFSFNATFNLLLKDGEVVHIEQVVRIMPKKRMVAFGTWRDKAVVAKLFFDPKQDKRHLEKEIKGVNALKENKIPTPHLLFEGVSEDKRISVLLFERILEADSLAALWQDKKEINDALPQLKAVIIELATQHVLGVLQHDMHLKNFLVTEKMIYTLDGAEIEYTSEILPKKTSMQNLALFLAQLGVGVESCQETLFLHYAKARGWLLKPEDTHEIFFLIKKWNESRWQHYQKKIFRECTDFASFADFRTFGMYQRNYRSPAFIQFLRDPEKAFQHPEAKMLKNGRSTTVIQLKLDDKAFVIKRYNLKNIWHRLRRALRMTRAATSWRLAQKLNLFGLQTAAPVAFIEKRLLGFRSQSYYVTEFIAGEHVGDYFKKSQNSSDNNMIKRIAQLLKNIAKLEMTHGDLKATNMLINHLGNPVLIDLDGAKEHASLSSLRSAWQKEIKRFLKYFKTQPELYAQFKNELS